MELLLRRKPPMFFFQGTEGGNGEGRSPGGNCHTTPQLKDCEEASGSEDEIK